MQICKSLCQRQVQKSGRNPDGVSYDTAGGDRGGGSRAAPGGAAGERAADAAAEAAQRIRRAHAALLGHRPRGAARV